MKIAIPADDKSKEGSVCQSFGRAPYFMIYDSESDECSFMVNSAATSQGGAGIKAAQMLVDKNVDIVLVPRCGQNAAEVLKAAGIKLYKSIQSSIISNIDAFVSGDLSLLSNIHPGFHGHGGK